MSGTCRRRRFGETLKPWLERWVFGNYLFGGALLAASVPLTLLAVRELCAGKGILFADRGEHALRGFEDPVRIYEIAWRS
jgi:hypothetical protein